ncbi:MAG: sulfotransferase family protein [Myxococcota bacterium]
MPQPQLIFVISPPRSGSTLLQRMLGSHSEIFTHPEPHLVTPLAHLGYHDTVDKAPYDHINAAEAIRLFVSHLPGGEADYLDALRAYADTMYGRMLATSKRSRFLDKTPAYALVLPFLAKLYPDAKYVVLTRHPLAVFSSYANSFFHGDWHAARDYNPILERYVPAMARFLRERPVPLTHVAYEDLVQAPEPHLERLFAFLGLPHEPEAVDYGERFEASKSGPGDPIGVARHGRPVTDSLHKWAAELAADPAKLELARQMVDRLDPADLETWGWPKRLLWDALQESRGATPPRPVWNGYTFQRRVLMALKKDIHDRPHGRLVKRIRYYCDVLLRE